MRRAAILRRFMADTRAASAAEFALLTPVFILFVFGMLDVGGYAWQLNMSQKATQFGARVAVVTDPVVNGLAAENYVGKTIGGTTLAAGDRIPAAALGVVKCTSATCTCATAPCPATLTRVPANFDRIYNRMRAVDPRIQRGNIVVEYRGSGLGYAGDPDGMEISPLTTVRLTGSEGTARRYAPLMGLIFKGGINLPDTSYTLTMEDGQGTVSN